MAVALRSGFIAGRKKGKPRPWQPPALHPINLVVATLICWALIAVLHTLLLKSQRNQGILFATNINDLGDGTKFMYRYFPTILAVLFSIYWSWIDGDAKRCQPYYQLAKKASTLGKDSLLLCYPTDWFLKIPFVAFNRKHWMVFWSSAGTFLMILGLVPMQAGIFSTRTINKTAALDFSTSVGFETTELQSTEDYLLSLIAIVAYNETLPPFMTKDHAIRPFAPQPLEGVSNTKWAAMTTVYSLDMQCENADSTTLTHYNTTDCLWANDLADGTHTNTIAPDSNWRTTVITGKVDNEACLDQHAFFAAIARDLTDGSEDSVQSTSLYCNVSYHEQVARIIVDSDSKSVISVDNPGPKKDLPSSLSAFVNAFEEGLFVGGLDEYAPGDTPAQVFSNLSTATSEEFPSVRFTGQMAAILEGRPLEDYLDARVFEESLLKACRLHFARAMVALLEENSAPSTLIQGDSITTSGAVILEPVFTYSTEAFLALISISALALLLLSFRGKWNIMQKKLFSDPGSMGSLMSLVADDSKLLDYLAALNQASTKHITPKLKEEEFRLADPNQHSSGARITLLSPGAESDEAAPDPKKGLAENELSVKTHFRPLEFHLGSGFLLTAFFIILMSCLAAFFKESRPNGLPLPFKSQVGHTFVTSYLPTLIAMLIEPLWILYTRMLCLYLPFQELLIMKAKPERSIDLNYSSVPPQLAFIKALRAKHLLLASVCAMALLSNVLATAFSGMLFREMRTLETTSDLTAWTNGRFRDISATLQFSAGHVIVAESQYKRGTSLPPWTDGKYMFLPFQTPVDPQQGNSTLYRARTQAFSSDFSCDELKAGPDFGLEVYHRTKRNSTSSIIGLNFQVNLRDDSNELVPCLDTKQIICAPPSDEDEELVSDNTTYSGLETSIQLKSTLDYDFGISPNPTLCESTIVLGWLRLGEKHPPDLCDQPARLYSLLTGVSVNTSAIGNSTYYYTNGTLADDIAKKFSFMVCQPKLVAQEATIAVDSTGYVQAGSVQMHTDAVLQNRSQEPYTSFLKNYVIENYFTQYNQLEFWWHSGTYSNDVLNRFLTLQMNSTDILDPSKGITPFEDISASLKIVHAKLFSNWLAIYRDIIFDADKSTAISGNIIREEERLFFNKAAFILSEIILGIFIPVAILMFARRPTKLLPRLPNSIGAIVPFFAGSMAVQDFKETGTMSKDERLACLKEKGPFVYGYGKYAGSGGRMHVGIERMPFVTAIEREEESRGRGWWRDGWKVKYRRVKQDHEE